MAKNKKQTLDQLRQAHSCQGCGYLPSFDKAEPGVNLSFGVAAHHRRGKPTIDLAVLKDRLEAYFYAWWNDVEVKDGVGRPKAVVHPNVEFTATGSHQRDLYFCSTDCLRAWFSRIVDVLENTRAKMRKESKNAPLYMTIENPDLRVPRRRQKTTASKRRQRALDT